MAIAPPSDILLDVVNAADPVKVRAATERLAKLAADPAAGNEAFSKALATAQSDGKAPSSLAVSHAPPMPAATLPQMSPASVKPIAGSSEVYQKFEAILLQNFVESMLPKDDELFGDKESAGAYRSMMAEQFASQLSKAGGIGIAAAVEHAHPASATKASSKV